MTPTAKPYIPRDLRIAATAQTKGYTVPIFPMDVLWLVESHGNLLAVLLEMFSEGPVAVAFAGNPYAIADLESRVCAAIAHATEATPPPRLKLGGTSASECAQTGDNSHDG